MPFWRSVIPMPERMRVILKKVIAVGVQRAGGWCQWRLGRSWVWMNTVELITRVNSLCWVSLWCWGGGCVEIEIRDVVGGRLR